MAERSLELDSIELAAAIFGSGDQNIHLLEKEFRVTAVCRGSVLRFTGEQKDVDAAARAVDGMVTLMENHTPLEEQTVRYCISLAHGGEEKRLRELTDDFVAVTAKGRPIHPKTLGQKEYLAAIRKNAITFGVGPAGTGKTYLAVAMAVKAFKSKDVSRIILTRPAVEAGEMTRGELAEKIMPEDCDLTPLTHPSELALMRKMADFGNLIALAARDRAPFRLTHYAQDLASLFHQFYTNGHVRTDDADVQTARLALCGATRVVLALTLNLLGVSAPVKM